MTNNYLDSANLLICGMEGCNQMTEYLTVQKHAWELSLAFEAIHVQTYDNEWLHIRDWLHMASGVLKTEIDTQFYNTSNLFCGSARDFEDNRSRLWSSFCKELITFNFIWGSMESLIEEITNATEQDSKPYLGKKFLKDKYIGKSIKKYDCVLKRLESLMKNSTYPYKKEVFKYSRSNYTGQGLHLVSKIRNSFAHGAASLPDPDDWADNLNIDIAVIETSSRMILLTMQMILIAHFSKKDLIIEYPFMFEDLDDLSNVSILLLLKNLHIQNYQDFLNKELS